MSPDPAAQLELTLDTDPKAALPQRLRRLGLPADVKVTLTRNRTVLVSFAARQGLRLHAGYAWAPDEVLRAIVIFLKPRVPRVERLAARQQFLRFPVERHAPVRRARGPAPVPEAHRPLLDRLERLHQILNERHFGGRLSTIAIRLSDRMATRLGEFQAGDDAMPIAITLSRRHLERDGWAAATETLLHEMVHQWQCENDLPLDHGAAFRRKARAVGIPASATVPAGYIPAPRYTGTIA
jgi:hypothetical protein